MTRRISGMIATEESLPSDFMKPTQSGANERENVLIFENYRYGTDKFQE